ncbi:MAG: family 20 glycosylhydrolase [Cellvibrio sp.]|uniref:family 20 glycosylhydrolase n=1 Tax=Cellvibrio sp. TaxID=1965322 RepID=UPI0031AA285E
MRALFVSCWLIMFGFWQSAIVSAAGLAQHDLDRVGNELVVSYEIVSNINDAAICQKIIGDNACYSGEISLIFPASLPNNDWLIYFGSRRTIFQDSSNDFDIKHVSGDVHTISFVGDKIVAGKAYVIPFTGKGYINAELQVLPNYFIAPTSQSLSARIIKSTEPKIDPETKLASLPFVKPFKTINQVNRSSVDYSPLATPEFLYKYHERINAFTKSAIIDENRTVPKVSHASFTSKRVVVVSALSVSEKDLENSELSVAFSMLEKKGVVLSTADKSKAIKLSLKLDKKADINAEAYAINIGLKSIDISAKTNAGLFYGLYTLSQLIDDNLGLSVGKVSDVPRYSFRGVQLDVSRNFHSKAFMLKLLDQMALLKLNKFHLHLADDEGWRLEIPGLPELTNVGAYRCYDPSEQKCLSPQLASGPSIDTDVNGYLSVDDYIDVIQYAAARHIDVIPALDMPGHSRAAVKAMEARYKFYMAEKLPEKANEYLLTEQEDKSIYRSIQHYTDNTLNPCIPSTYRFVDKVLSEIIDMHQRAGVPLKRYHIGADETAGAWRDSPACNRLVKDNKNIHDMKELTGHFIEQIAQKVSAKGIVPAVWGDGLDHANKDNLPDNMQVNVWGLLPDQIHNQTHNFVNLGFDTILSVPDVLYFDFPYQADPNEQGNPWGSRSVDTFKVFQFMPDNLPAHAEIWPDLMGNQYSTKEKVTLNKGHYITGIQAQLWTETTRTSDVAGYMYFPRLIAFAERAWHKPEWEVPYISGRAYSPTSQQFSEKMKQQQLQDWAQFSHTLVNKVLPNLVRDDMFFRLPVPGAKIEGNTLYANSMYEDLYIEYRLLTGKKIGEWKVYKNPVQLKEYNQIELRSRLEGLSRTGRVVTIDRGEHKNAASN